MRCARGAVTVGVMEVTSPPIWLVALVLAAFAPWGVRALQLALEQRLRRRTLAMLARAGMSPSGKPPRSGEPGGG